MIHNVKRTRIDRVSSLPNELLNQILGCLPIRDAVATRILSTSWRHLYPFTTNLEFDATPLYMFLDCPGIITCFTTFIKSVFVACHSNNLTRFCVNIDRGKIGHENYPDLNSTTIHTWISFPLLYGIKELDLCIYVRNDEIKLPPQLFSSVTLEKLSLETNLEIRNPAIYLPNLKGFYLKRVYVPDYCFLDKLFSGCPSLEDLFLDRCSTNDEDMVINISKVSLRKLFIDISMVSASVNDPPVFVDSLDTPNLQYLKYINNFANHYSTGYMNALDEAIIDIPRGYGGLKSMLSFLRALTNVTRLSFHITHQLPWVEGLNSLPVFFNVKHLELELDEFRAWNEVLLKFLSCSPSLNTLKLLLSGSGDGSDYGSCDEWWRSTRSQGVPFCLTSHLIRVAIRECAMAEAQLQVAEYFLRNGSVLQKLTVHCLLNDNKLLSEAELERMPKASDNCVINIVE